LRANSDRRAAGLRSRSADAASFPQQKENPPLHTAGWKIKTAKTGKKPDHFCHVRFLWRFDFKRFLRLCVFIFNRRFFFRLPIVNSDRPTCCRPARL
jgi:hypothetical protein